MKINLGIIGLSSGNGHPYSWSAICNGYEALHMKSCPFPVIYEYLSQQSYPSDFIPNVQVSHIWTQDPDISKKVSESAKIPNIVDKLEDLIGKVDGVLLARDDAEKHFEQAEPFIRAGLPIYIDKPIATSVKDLNKLFEIRKFDNQIFTCSALAYANELILSPAELEELGEIKYVDALCCSTWDKYAVHVIEPVIKNLPNLGNVLASNRQEFNSIQKLNVSWSSGVVTDFTCYGKELAGPIEIRFIGTKSYKTLTFQDTFFAFKSALEEFVAVVRDRSYIPNKDEFVSKVVHVIELGLK
jgi:hypothetical protein